jgi:hypothetical protein
MNATSRQTPSDERRRHRRVPAFCAVELSSADKPKRCGVTRDASGRGLRVVTPSRFEVGDALSVAVYVDGEEMRLTGRAVRVEENGWETDEPWRYRLSIALDEEIPGGALSAAEASAARRPAGRMPRAAS